jgi:Phage capsid family
MKSLGELRQQEVISHGAEFVTIAKMLFRASRDGGWSEAALIAERERRVDERVARICKNAVAAGSMTANDTALIADLNVVSSGFLSAVANIGVFDRMLPDMVRVPLDSPRAVVSTIVPSVVEIGEGSAKPITRFSVAPGALNRRKAASIIVMTDELAKSMSAAAQSLLAKELRKGVAASTDAIFLATITAGVTPIVGTTDVFTDLAAMLAAIDSDASSRFFLVVDPDTVKRLATAGSVAGGRMHPDLTPSGGTLCGIPVIVSDQAALSGSPVNMGAVLVDAAGIAADSGPVTLDQTEQAALLMDDAPVMSSGGVGSPTTPVGANLVSLWQTNSRAIRAERFFGFVKLRSDAVQMVSGASW